MNDQNRVCPVCNAELSPADEVCPNCGFLLAGATQVFSGLTGEVEIPHTSKISPLPLLKIVKGPSAGQVFSLVEDLMTIGRDPNCSIFLNDMTVSREHCKIERRQDSIYLTDMNSLNGTWVNGAIVSEAELFDGATIQVGTFVMALDMNPKFN
ncbi:MAG: FHA domain-containing protein [Coriobacteriia bacterium]|nr:FHA domain-containing protein [Coriobacteriia bacterium]